MWLPILALVLLAIGVYVAKDQRRALVGAALGVAALALVFWGRPTGTVVLGLTLALLVSWPSSSSPPGRRGSRPRPSRWPATRPLLRSPRPAGPGRLARLVPAVDWLAHYRRVWLRAT